MLRPLLVVITILGAMTGCSGDERPDEAHRDQVADGLGALFAGDHPVAEDAATAACFADEVLDRVSLDRLQDAGVVDDQHHVVADVPPLPDDVAEDWATAQLTCTDFVAESTDAQERISKGRLDRPAYAACLGAAVPHDDLRMAIAASLTGRWDDPALTALSEAQATCRRKATPTHE